MFAQRLELGSAWLSGAPGCAAPPDCAAPPGGNAFEPGLCGYSRGFLCRARRRALGFLVREPKAVSGVKSEGEWMLGTDFPSAVTFLPKASDFYARGMR